MDCLVAMSIVTLPHSMPTCSLRELMSPREQKPAGNSATNFASSMFFEPDRPWEARAILVCFGCLEPDQIGWQCPEARPCLKSIYLVA